MVEKIAKFGLKEREENYLSYTVLKARYKQNQ